MFTRTFNAALLALAGCGQGVGNQPVAKALPVECALNNAADFTSDCGLEASGDASRLTILHPDGGFRRFVIGTDGVMAADGADGVIVHALKDGRSEIAIGTDRYRLKLAQ